MEKLFRTVFVVTLGLSILGGIAFVLFQMVALVPGDLALLKGANKTVKPWLVLVGSICAIAAFALQYFKPEPELVEADA